MYLTNDTKQFQSPQNLLSNLISECYDLMKEMCVLKEKQNIIDNQIYELKQKVVWMNLKKVEIISKIKEDLAHHTYSLN